MVRNKDQIPDTPRRVYGRRSGRPLNPARKNALETLLPVFSIDPSSVSTPSSFDPATLFPFSPQAVHVEIGFGDGEHLAGRIKQNPQICYIGAEPYLNGMAAFLKTLQENNLNEDQVKVWMDDAIRLLQSFTPQSIERIYVLNPDPWPKARHHKRRIINPVNLALFARLLKPGSDLIMTTDVDELAEWMLTQTSNTSDFIWTACHKKDWQTPPEDWIKTRYELKGKEAGHRQTYLHFKRL